MWFKSGNTSLDLNEVSSVVLLQEEKERVVIIMKNNREITIQTEGNVTPAIAYKSITDLLQETRKRDERIMVNTFELLKSIRSELKLISQNLRRLS